MKRLLYLTLLIGIALHVQSAWAQQDEDYERPPIRYSASQSHEVVSRLQERIASANTSLGTDGREIVQTLLRELHIPIESQLLVFSKTSFQRQRITPGHPRSLFFTDTCYVGWVPSGLIEVTAIDPVLGPIFYTLDPLGPRTNSLVRDADCLRCHGGNFIRGIPGVFARSVFTDDKGEPLLRFGSEIVDFRTPFTNRWGGWYVTGKHGAAFHRGNVFASEKSEQLVVDFKPGANLTNLSGFFDVGAYLTNTSDIVALLIFEQQLQVQNALTRAALDSRSMLEYQKNLQRELKQPITEEAVYDSVKSVFESSSRELVDDLFFKDEALLPEGIEGSAAFQRAFCRNSPHATDGSSLKDLLLQGHLFKNRCSYLVYSDTFKQLPKPFLRLVRQKMAQALGPTRPDPRYSYLGVEERARISRILRETCPELRDALAAQVSTVAR
jgi:hypothetical protein